MLWHFSPRKLFSAISMISAIWLLIVVDREEHVMMMMMMLIMLIMVMVMMMMMMMMTMKLIMSLQGTCRTWPPRRWNLGLRLSPLMIEVHNAVLLLVTCYDMKLFLARSIPQHGWIDRGTIQ